MFKKMRWIVGFLVVAGSLSAWADTVKISAKGTAPYSFGARASIRRGQSPLGWPLSTDTGGGDRLASR